MKVEYRNPWFNYLLLLLAGGFVLYLIVFERYFLFDYEYFGLTTITLLGSVMVFLSEFIYSKIELNNKGIKITGWKSTRVDYEDLKGIASGSNSFDIITKTGARYNIGKGRIINISEVEEFLFNRKNIRKLPLRYSIKLTTVLLVFYGLSIIGYFIFSITGNLTYLKDSLPLSGVEVTLISGVTVNKAKVIGHSLVGECEGLRVNSIELEEYPNIKFKFPSEVHGLQNNSAYCDSEFKMIEKGTKVEIKVRKEDYNKIKDRFHDEITSIRFYSLAIDGLIKLEKMHLKY